MRKLAAIAVSCLILLSGGVAAAARAPDQLPGCLDEKGNITSLNTCPAGGVPVPLNLHIPPADLLGEDPFRGEVDVVEFGPFRVSFGVSSSIDLFQWIRVTSDSFGEVYPPEGEFSITIDSGEFVIGGNVDQIDMVVDGPYLIQSLDAKHFIRIDLTWFVPFRAVTELTFFTTTGDRPQFHSYKRENVFDPGPDTPTFCRSLEC